MSSPLSRSSVANLNYLTLKFSDNDSSSTLEQEPMDLNESIDPVEPMEDEPQDTEGSQPENAFTKETNFAFPKRAKNPALEFKPYWYTMAWPHLFPYGTGTVHQIGFQ